MDRSLLERMIGATVLVVLLVVVAPALLDGRKLSGGTDQEEELLVSAGQSAPVRVKTIRVNGAADVAPTERAVTSSQPAPKSEPQAAPSAPAASLKPAAKPAVSGWVVQLGSFSTKANAQKYADEIQGKGFPTGVTSFRSGGKTMYRVQAGPEKSRESADTLAAKLQKAGYKGLVRSAG